MTWRGKGHYTSSPFIKGVIFKSKLFVDLKAFEGLERMYTHSSVNTEGYGMIPMKYWFNICPTKYNGREISWSTTAFKCLTNFNCRQIKWNNNMLTSKAKSGPKIFFLHLKLCRYFDILLGFHDKKPLPTISSILFHKTSVRCNIG